MTEYAIVIGMSNANFTLDRGNIILFQKLKEFQELLWMITLHLAYRTPEKSRRLICDGIYNNVSTLINTANGEGFLNKRVTSI